MIHTACFLANEGIANFQFMLLLTASEYGEPAMYRFARDFYAIDTSDPESLALTLEHEKTDFIYTSVIDVIETATGCDDFKLSEIDATECEEGRDYHTPLECQITDYELLLIAVNGAHPTPEIVIKTIGGGEEFHAYTHDQHEGQTVSAFLR